MFMSHKNVCQLNEKGFASMVVALTVVIVLALLTIGFAQLTRREQQNALNKQLASQANYAAETAINDAVKYMRDHPGYVPSSTGECLDSSDPLLQAYSPDIDSSTGVSYSCLIIDNAPNNLYYTDVQPGSSKKVVFSTGALAPNPMTIEWDSSTRNVFPNNTSGGLKPATGVGAWLYPALLQFSVTPLGSGVFDRAAVANNTFTAYLYPTNNNVANANTSYGPSSNQGRIVAASCSVVGSGSHCSAQITNLTTPGNYVISFLNLYDTSNITIKAGNAGTPIKFIGGQILVDATGRARDVLKRLQVRVCVSAGSCSAIPATEGQNICKRLQTKPIETTFSDISGTGACNLSTGGGLPQNPASVQTGPNSVATQVPGLAPRTPDEFACDASGAFIGPGLGTSEC